jgi:hypothetical protein
MYATAGEALVKVFTTRFSSWDRPSFPREEEEKEEDGGARPRVLINLSTKSRFSRQSR